MLEIVEPSKFSLDNRAKVWADNAFYCQSQSWIESVGSSQEECYVTKENDNIIAYSYVKYKKFPLGIGRVAVIERGPVARDINALELHLKQITEKKDLIQIEVSPFNQHLNNSDVESTLAENGWLKRSFQRAIYTNTVTVDLAPTEEELRKNLRRSLKTQINKAKKLELDICVNTQVEKAIEFHNDFARSQGIAEISEKEKRLLLSSVLQDDKTNLVLTAWKNDKMIGAIILLAMGNTILYQWGVSHRGEEYRKLPITHLLHWEAICLAKKRGYSFYDFGGYWLEKGDSNPINRFKTGFSKDIDSLVGEHFFRVSRARSWLYEAIIERRK
ncbi:lipid II:glycine glycyltransferase FemX [Aliikangiella sp. IMCC44359]|uniref:lipid II:glycine glycyltransferase FemX n=1 Tax=Aliikangiella sp. IMCC44359 TaxID=3459125 RepID=UPI00403B2D0B